jgi:hypothetical protein
MRHLFPSRLSVFGAIIFLLLLCGSIQADCWRWITKTLPGTPQSGQWLYGSLMAYDEDLQKLVLLNIDDQYVLAMWTYDGSSWNPIWSGPPPPDDGWHGWVPFGMYFDQNLKAIVVLAATVAADYAPYWGFFEFDAINGWNNVACINCGGTECYWGIQALAYDSGRKRAVITGFGDAAPWSYGPPITLEFDGTHVTKALNSPTITLNYGTIGYDSESGKTLFYGWGRNCWSEEMETFEYDGISWKLTVTEQRPSTNGHQMEGLVYVPQLIGLIGATSVGGTDFQTWLYKNSEWQQIPMDKKMPARGNGVLGFDNSRNTAVYWGGDVLGSDSVDTIELKLVKHCRPTAKP